MAMGDWTDEENDTIVADYFAMLIEERLKLRYNKAEHNRKLQERIQRGRGSVEYKHQNISAVLKGFGEAWIPGYKPAFNYQSSLEDAVERWLASNPDWLARLPTVQPNAMQEPVPLWVGPPPNLINTPPPEELEQTMAVARKFDVAGRDERNRELGRAGEKRAVTHERAVLIGAGRSDLAKRVEWVSVERGDGAGFDISSFWPDGRRRLIEVKTTNGWERTPFHISRNELAVAEVRRDEWSLMRIWNFQRDARAFELRPPLDAHVALTPTSFQASFQ